MTSTSKIKIIIRAPNWVGDQVMAGPFYRAIREHYCSAELTLLGVPRVMGLNYSEIFQNTITIDPKKNAWSFGRDLRNQKYDLALSLPSSFSSAILFLAAGIKNRVGFSEGGSDLLWTSHIYWKGRNSGRHKAELYLELAEFLTGKSVPLKNFSPKNNVNSFLIVAPGASIPLRQWPGFADLILKLRKQFPARKIFVVGAAGESSWKSWIRNQRDFGIEDWIERTTLPELLQLMGRSELVIANDSGPSHLAAMAGVPVLTLFGPGDPAYIRPLTTELIEIKPSNLPCSPCEKAWCASPYGYQACLKQLTVEDVFRKISEKLSA